MSAYVDDAPADGRIVDLAKQTTSRLEVLWDEVGYTPEEKRRQMQGLIDGFQTLCENKVSRVGVLVASVPESCYTILLCTKCMVCAGHSSGTNRGRPYLEVIRRMRHSPSTLLGDELSTPVVSHSASSVPSP